MGRDPSVIGISYRLMLQQGTGIRLEWTSNRSVADRQQYIGLGFFWYGSGAMNFRRQ